MARTAITVQTAAAFGGKVEDVTWTAADAANNMQFTHPGGDVVLLIQNGHSGPLDVVLNAVASARTFNMAEDITISTTNAEVSACVIPDQGFDQGSGVVHLDIATDTNLELAVIKPTASK
jgi:hypothetical protein